MGKLPCIDCITLPVCRNVFKDNELVFDNKTAREALQKRCSIIDLYVDPPFSKRVVADLRCYALNAFMLYGEIKYEKYI